MLLVHTLSGEKHILTNAKQYVSFVSRIFLVYVKGFVTTQPATVGALSLINVAGRSTNPRAQRGARRFVQ